MPTHRLARLFRPLRRHGLQLAAGALLLTLISCRLLDPSPGPAAFGGNANGNGNGGGGTGGGTATLAAGTQLYAANCARCHGDQAEGTSFGLGIQGRADIAVVVRNGKGSMPPFTFSDTQIASIVLFLAQYESPADTLTGGPLFASQCARCHGPNAEGMTNSGPGLQLETGIATITRNGLGDMPAFPNLTDEQIASLEAWLQTVPFERTGRNLYVRYCQACHGGNARGTSRGNNIRRELDEIYEAVSRGKRGMPAFPQLSTADVNLIRAYIASL